MKIRSYLSIVLLLAATMACSLKEKSNDLRILFIGNSYTYYNSTPELVKQLIQERFPNRSIEIELISGGGMTLEQHWERQEATRRIKDGDWDYVVLQEQSRLGMGVVIENEMYFGKTDQFFKYARKFNAEIEKAGAQSVFFMTWSLQNKLEDQAILSYAYTNIAKELNAKLAPVGLIWEELQNESDLNLYADDGGHPSPIGSYTAAVNLFTVITNSDPKGLSGEISGRRLSSTGQASEEEQILVRISEDEARLIQSTTWKALEKIDKASDYPNFEEPKPNYSIPKPERGEKIEVNKVLGKWYGSSTYSSSYFGQILEISLEDNIPTAKLSFYSEHGAAQLQTKHFNLSSDNLTIEVYDALRSRNTSIVLSLNKENLNGISKSSGNIEMYKHFAFSREKEVNGINLSSMEFICEKQNSDSDKVGFVDAKIKYYQNYSEVIGEEFIPQEFYLLAVGQNYLMDGDQEMALHYYELSYRYYPESINSIQSYAEFISQLGRKEEAIHLYEKALQSDQKKYATFQKNIDALKKTNPQNAEALPPPPPPL